MSDNSIQFEGTQFSYDVQTGTTTEGDQRYFHIAVGLQDVGDIETFEELLKSIRTMLFQISSKEPQVLWNDIGLHYARESYPAIYELENLMRKLITKFMLTSIGLTWTKETIPKEVLESIKVKKQVAESNYLHQVDFIQLSNFLFKPYTTGNTAKILETVATSMSPEELNLDELRKLIPRSNWERYFSPLVDCESDYLRIRWEQLYDLRNHVAHNRAVSRADRDQINELVNQIRPKIEAAIGNLGDIKLTEMERETVAESVAIGRYALNGEFIEHWKLVHDRLLTLAYLVSSEKNQAKLERLGKNVASVLNILREEGAISSQFRKSLRQSHKLRNIIVHHSDVIFPESRLNDEVDMLRILINELENSIAKVSEGGTLKFDEEQFNLDDDSDKEDLSDDEPDSESYENG
ncbi:hypothetical protein ACN4EG_27645 [Alkalinema pantanalense CENA528]|uniref:hypothetical protein n=1 Tax=Alkalinema pantanalense TaxID=1620705 RepID=UPI003D6DE250